MALGWQIYRIPGLLSVKIGREHFCLPDRLTDQTSPHNKRGKRLTGTQKKQPTSGWATNYGDTGRSSILSYICVNK